MTHYHFIGIAGIGMSAIAKLLLLRGIGVSGSDLSHSGLKQTLRDLGAVIYDTHSANNVPPGCTVVYSSDIQPGHPELEAAKAKGCRVLHRAEALAELLQNAKYSLAVSGTHGKTTTSAMLTEIFMAANKSPTYALGGLLNKTGANAESGKEDYFIIEADESDSSFLHYKPFGAIITNIDLDHMNHFRSEANLLDAFKRFASHVQSPEQLVWCWDDERLRSLQLPGVSYGYSKGAQAHLTAYRQKGWKASFDLTWRGKVYPMIEISLPGKHYAMNAAAAFILASLSGIEETAIREALAHFSGVKRRMERIDGPQHITLIDDYAHHPTEIEAVLKSVRAAVGPGRLLAIFQPHRYSRMESLKDDFAAFYRAFLPADIIVATDLYSAGEQPIHGVSSEIIHNALKKELEGRVQFSPRDKLVDWVCHNAKPFDTIVFLGAGDISAAVKESAESLKRHPTKKFKLGVAYGGPSTEHYVSVNSSKFILENLDRRIYDVETFAISREGHWRLANKDSKAKGERLESEVLEKMMKCDVFFPIMHGTYGEDGIVQGFFEALGKPYVGCDHRSSAICMDKVIAKQVIAYHGVPVVPFVHISERSWREDADALLEDIKNKLTFPLIIKPTHLGTSVNISEAANIEDVPRALELVFKADTDAIIENRLIIRDIEFAVLGNEEVYVFPPGEICTKGKIYSYEDKVGPNGPEITPIADLPQELVEKGMKLAKTAYHAFGCKGMARVDFLLDSHGNIWFNEINPIPGFTSISLYPMMCEVNGIPPQQLMNELVINAFARHRRQQEKSQFQPPSICV